MALKALSPLAVTRNITVPSALLKSSSCGTKGWQVTSVAYPGAKYVKGDNSNVFSPSRKSWPALKHEFQTGIEFKSLPVNLPYGIPARKRQFSPSAFLGSKKEEAGRRSSERSFGAAPVAASTAPSSRNSDAGRGSIKQLKASQIKKVLELGGVDYRDCLEKQELVARLEQTQKFVPPVARRLLDRYLQGAEEDTAGAEDLAFSASSLDAASASQPVQEARWWLEAERNTIRRFQQASPAVAHITSTGRAMLGMSMNPVDVPRGTGSGFIWDKEGHVVTNYHVVMNGQGAKVTLSDASSWDAELVGVAASKDLAVLKIKTPPAMLTPVSVGTSQDLQVGQHVMAIGNPFGLDRTLTAGIISGVGRDIKSVSGRTIKGVVQTDASINPGNSGGPLLDSQGRLIGVNTAIYSPSGASAGVGFAIPVDTVRRVVNALIRDGRVTRPALGVVCASDSQAKQLGVTGVLVMDMSASSPAAKAGIRATSRDPFGRITLGDVIVAINGQTLSKVEDLLSVVEEHNVGETVRVSVKRGSSLRDCYVTLDEIND